MSLHAGDRREFSNHPAVSRRTRPRVDGVQCLPGPSPPTMPASHGAMSPMHRGQRSGTTWRNRRHPTANGRPTSMVAGTPGPTVASLPWSSPPPVPARFLPEGEAAIWRTVGGAMASTLRRLPHPPGVSFEWHEFTADQGGGLGPELSSGQRGSCASTSPGPRKYPPDPSGSTWALDRRVLSPGPEPASGRAERR